MKNEEWRDVPGWEGAYRVSDGGRVTLRDGLRPVRVGVAELVASVFYPV